MKIGVVTFWQGNDNYGMILQCWALQKYLRQLGHNPYIIRYIPEQNISYIKKIIKTLTFYPIVKKLYHYKKFRLINSLNKKSKSREFDKFRNKNLTLSSKLYKTLKDIQKNPPQADCYITGSDQVWAQLLDNPNNRVFFLDFGNSNIKRIAYAPSFAMKVYPEYLKQKLQICLSKINNISCREYDGVNICNELGFDAVKVLDPTLLITKEEYISLIGNIKTPSNQYIFIYSLNIKEPDEIRWNELKQYSKENDFRIIATPSNGYFPGLEIFPDEVEYSYSTVQQWLSYILNSSLVVTPSFHGIVLSIILEKDFVYVPLKGKYSGGNNRVIDLLKDLGLLNRILQDNLSLIHIIHSQIDWKLVKNRLHKLQQSSNNFLKNSLKTE